MTPRTAAIMPVHLYGHPAQMPALLEIAKRHGLLVVEDSAQAHGAALDGTPAGAFGTLGAFSFYPTKNMTTGEGGMITTADYELARKCRLLRRTGHGSPLSERDGWPQRAHDRHGRSDRARATHSPRRVDGGTPSECRAYDAGLTRGDHTCGRCRALATSTTSTRSARRIETGWSQRLREQDIGCRCLLPDTRSSACHHSDSRSTCPTPMASHGRSCSIPVHPFLTDDERSRIIEVINQ